MNLREPAGVERGQGDSAEFSCRARRENGVTGNTRDTVREKNFAGALSGICDLNAIQTLNKMICFIRVCMFI